MGNDYMSLDELRYYRNLLALEVGDVIEWVITPFAPTSIRIRGTITGIYPEGKGAFIGRQHAFMTVFAPPLNYSVSLTNPTLKKLETDK